MNLVLNKYLTDLNIVLAFQEPQKTEYRRRRPEARQEHWVNQKIEVCLNLITSDGPSFHLLQISIPGEEIRRNSVCLVRSGLLPLREADHLQPGGRGQRRRHPGAFRRVRTPQVCRPPLWQVYKPNQFVSQLLLLLFQKWQKSRVCRCGLRKIFRFNKRFVRYSLSFIFLWWLLNGYLSIEAKFK